MGTLKTAIDIILIILGMSTLASLPSLVRDMGFLAAKDAQPAKYMSLKKWTERLTK